MLAEGTISDLPAIRRIVAESFLSDPMMEWVFPDPETRLDSVAAWLGIFAEGYLLGGRVDVIRDDGISLAGDPPQRLPLAGDPPQRFSLAGDPPQRLSLAGDPPQRLQAVAMWRMPDHDLEFPSTPSISGLLAALVGRTRAEEIGTGLRTIGTLTPTQPFAYLHFLAVDRIHQREGLGTQAVEPGLTAAGQSGLGAHLETTKPSNIPFYRSLGFEVSGHHKLGPGGPEMWALWKDAPNSNRAH